MVMNDDRVTNISMMSMILVSFETLENQYILVFLAKNMFLLFLSSASFFAVFAFSFVFVSR